MAISNMAQVLKWLGFLSTLVSCKHHHVFVFLRGEIKIRLGLETIMSFPYFPDIGRYRNMFTVTINVSTAKQCTHYYTHASQFVQLSHLTRLASCWSVLCACRASRSFSSSMARLISSTSLWLYKVERIPIPIQLLQRLISAKVTDSKAQHHKHSYKNHCPYP